MLDLTTTELADELVGGVLSAGPDRMAAAAELGLPQVRFPVVWIWSIFGGWTVYRMH